MAPSRSTVVSGSTLYLSSSSRSPLMANDREYDRRGLLAGHRQQWNLRGHTLTQRSTYGVIHMVESRMHKQRQRRIERDHSLVISSSCILRHERHKAEERTWTVIPLNTPLTL